MDQKRNGSSDATGKPSLKPDDYLYLRSRQTGRSLLGRVWNSPNTLLGLVYGGLGYGVGKLAGTNPQIRLQDGAVQFTYNPFGGVGALTLGDTTTWNGDPYDPNEPYDPEHPERSYHNADGSERLEYGTQHTYREHEHPHRLQGDVLGPLYLPSNVLGGLYGMLRDGEWHGPHNWNERGPSSDPPTAWAPRR